MDGQRRTTLVHVNAWFSQSLLMIAMGGMIYMMIVENGNMSDVRFMACLAILGAIVYGIVDIAKKFAGIAAICRRCGFRDGDSLPPSERPPPIAPVS